MEIFNTIRDWQKRRYDEKVAQMQSLGKCPDCRGTGINYPLAVMEYMYTNVNDCPSCNGSGAYADWAAIHSPIE